MFHEDDFTKPVYKSGDIAKILGVTTQTVRTYEDEGRIAYTCSEGGHRLVKRNDLVEFLKTLGWIPRPGDQKLDVIYARVSDLEQAKDGSLDRQALQVLQLLPGMKYPYVLKDVGLASDANREQLCMLCYLVAMGRVRRVCVLRRDILASDGYGYLETLFFAHGVEIVSVEDGEMDAERKSDLQSRFEWADGVYQTYTESVFHVK